jgi:DNA-binding NtrC family response regulator
MLRAKKSGAGPKDQAAERNGTRGKGQRILVADDERGMRDIYRQALEAFGYQVSLAADGAEALEAHDRAREEGRPFGLVVLDMTMPGMDGAACARTILERDPQARIIIATGHHGGCRQMSGLPSQVRGVLHKPFNINTLLNEVSRALAA